MKVCFISVEIFAWGKYGGFGRATRTIGRELVERGIEVTAVVPRRKGQSAVENLNGITVLGFKPSNIMSAVSLFRKANADIYHSEEPSFSTYLAMHAMPDRSHIVTFRDTRSAWDWRTEFSLPSLSALQVISNWVYEDSWLVRRAVRQADGVYAAAQLLIPKARNKYHLKSDPVFLPTPVRIPANVEKSAVPTVCFVSRWDRRKRPELFFELIDKFPNVQFLAAGRSRDEQWDQYLRTKYGHLPNLEILGFIDQFQSDRLSSLLGKSWILVNTAAREGLPNAYIEAAAHRCAILSAVDPDGFASQFGYHASQDDFAEGLEVLLQNDRWVQCAQRGYDYVRETFDCDKAIDQHLTVYEGLGKDRGIHVPENAWLHPL
jgi:glycosyltransferase involved in cell wall biosynthesis